MVLLAGMILFFLPLITTNPPVFHKERWSLWDMVWLIFTQEFPTSGLAGAPSAGQFLLLDFGVIYALFLYALVRLHRQFQPSRLACIGLFGMLYTYVVWKWDADVFERVFYGHLTYKPSSIFPVIHVGFVSLVLVLLAIWGSFVWIVTHEDIDEPLPENPESRFSSPAPEPEVIEAEMTPDWDTAPDSLPCRESRAKQSKEQK